MEVYGRRVGVAANKDELVGITAGEKAAAIEVEVKADTTKPPARFNEATLLSAMEGAGKLVDDEALAEAMSERGLGTPATRAAIIEDSFLKSTRPRWSRPARHPEWHDPHSHRARDEDRWSQLPLSDR